jgi:C4-dicarboxylate-specific signal transduction histidine kinase
MGMLQQKTDRLALVESQAFSELRQFAGDVLDWMAGERLRERERRRKAERERVHQQKQTADERMRQVLSELSPESQRVVNEALQRVQAAHEAEVNLLTETAQLYYTLGTVGTTAAAFAHQTKHPLGAIVADANALENWLGNPNELLLFRDNSSRAVKRIKLEADAIYTFADVTLKLLEHEKRRSRRHAIHDLIDGAVKLLEPYVEARQAKVERDFAAENPHIWCSRAAFEAIVTNFITNSLQAFVSAERDGALPVDEPRRILLWTRVQGEKVVMSVLDNGPGIEGISVEDVWLPGRTTTEKGTGLGLTIVRDVVLDLGGNVEAVGHGELGGAKFVVTLPLRK